MNRGKKLALNTTTSFVLQVITIICGFILPRLILANFGSNVYGLVNSITQFLSIIAFLELGVGAVVQSSLFQPLAEKDTIQVSKICVSANRFFRKLALILLAYVLFLIVVYPVVINNKFDYIYTATLIGAISISSFAQYYFGVVDALLLTADQRGYIQNLAQIITLILNTIACVVLIVCGSNIQIVKLTTSLIYLLRPIYLRWYINRKYNIDRKISYTKEPISQKWNGVAQHVAAVVLDNTDVVVLTLFSTLPNVSIYSVYFLVVNGVKTLFTSMTKGIGALFGELWARKELDELKRVFEWSEWAIHTGVVFVFGCTASLIVPFVQVYTLGVDDADYVVPAFALLITIANGLHCLRLPYNLMILAGGHYKQTQSNYIIAACLNIIISISTVYYFGLIGVAIGTVMAMLYQTVWMAYYDLKNFVNFPLKLFYKHLIVDCISFVIAFLICNQFSFTNISWLGWILFALRVVIIWLVLGVFINLLFYPLFIKRCIKKCYKIIWK